MRRWTGGVGVLLAACGSTTEVRLDFGDAVVEARARTVVTQVLRGLTCEQVLERTAQEVSALAEVVDQRTSDVPARPEAILPEGEIPAGALVHAAARDEDGLVFARACVPLSEEVSSVVLRLDGFPICAAEPRALDVSVVFDASGNMGFADPTFGGVAGIFRQRFAGRTDFPNGSRFSLVTHGEGAGALEISGASSALALADAVDQLASTGYAGAADGFDAITRGARQLRDSATCGRRAVMLVVSAGANPQTPQVLPADAAFALYASQGVRADDVFTYGIALTQEALDDLLSVIPDTVGEVRGALSRSSLESAFTLASFTLRQSVSSSGD